MKKLTLQTIAALLLVVAIGFSSCSKEGPEGPQGAQGPAGPTGANGAQGPAGTANVIYSDWLDVTFSADTVHNGAKIDTIGFYTAIEAPKLTSDILATGDMKVYVNLDAADDPYIAPLPYFSIYDGVTIESKFYSGTIELYSNINAGTIQTQNGKKYQQYRYILIPGGTSARKSSVTVDWNDYNAVKKYLNLKD